MKCFRFQLNVYKQFFDNKNFLFSQLNTAVSKLMQSNILHFTKPSILNVPQANKCDMCQYQNNKKLNIKIDKEDQESIEIFNKSTKLSNTNEITFYETWKRTLLFRRTLLKFNNCSITLPEQENSLLNFILLMMSMKLPEVSHHLQSIRHNHPKYSFLFNTDQLNLIYCAEIPTFLLC